ncbi:MULTISPECIES: LuxR C-terminal-related transcriptional regulator [unclassified Saccharothrix]|uniref:LuxR C-terminal-related transcriptional regulator n=1 Tax=unclassified Saccharothrix TaxID=2593673 RepID=UPI00307CFA41
MFSHLGVPDEQARVYERLVHIGSCTVEEAQTRPEVLEALHRLGVVRRVDTDVWQAVPPDLAVEMLIASREDGHRRARAEAAPLMDAYLRNRAEHHHDTAMVEVVNGADAVRDLWQALLAGARSEVCVLDQPPYISPVEEHVALEVDTRRRQVQWRVIYDRSSVELPGRLAEIAELVASGERARVTPTLPFKLAVVDARVAVLPVSVRTTVDQILLIRPSPLLDVLTSMFDLYWDNSIPFNPGASGAEVDTQLLALLAAGLTDESIARHLGLGPRTVQRRVRQLMDRCGAQTRFQAGVQAMRRGWL